MKKVICIIVAVLFLLVLTGVVNRYLLGEPESESYSSLSSSSKKIFKVGDTQIVQDFEITLFSVENKKSYNLGYVISTKYNFVEVGLRIKNIYNKERTFYSSDYFVMQNGNQYERSSEVVYCIYYGYSAVILAGETVNYYCVCETLESSNNTKTSFVIKDGILKTKSWLI